MNVRGVFLTDDKPVYTVQILILKPPDAGVQKTLIDQIQASLSWFKGTALLQTLLVLVKAIMVFFTDDTGKRKINLRNQMFAYIFATDQFRK